MSLHDLAADLAPRADGLVPLDPLEAFRFTRGDLRMLWDEAMSAPWASPSRRGGSLHRNVPVGPYRLAVVPSVRGRSAGQVALQGMPNKQIEMLIPSIRSGSSSDRMVIAIWTYRDASLLLVYTDFKGYEHYILWHATNAHQMNYEDLGELNHMLYTLGMEVPDRPLDRVLSKKFRPKSTA